ncbi:hypothetical protein VHEMI02767 [[Torrubiella] hemipterigena]|uniref:Rhodanese domain-containing protein n=1 Tax=[Torrubiella] hemipterigena TaxID=1531966 RepID=A0A0A1SQN7_9HYPO|nr:hypothetical protein VHEMI02767 [[Torrubiella] hemipterigena]
MSIHTPPAGAQSIAQILEEARSHLQRISAAELLRELQDDEQPPTYVVDIRPAAQRAREGEAYLPEEIDGRHKILVIERNVLEWRFDPQADSRLKDIVDARGYDTRVVIGCSEGYTSSLAARELQRLGLQFATDLEGGFSAWRALLEAGANEGESSTPRP